MNPIRLSMFTTEERIARREAAELARAARFTKGVNLWNSGMDFLASIRAELSGQVSALRETADTLDSIGIQKWN